MLRFTLAILAISLALGAQQTGDANRDYTVNGVGSLGTSFVASTLATPGTFSQAYNTLDAHAPAVWAVSDSGSIGLFTTATNSVDIDFTDPSFAFVAYGGGPAIIDSFFFTNDQGDMALNLGVSPALVGTTLFSAFAHVSATSPDGFYVSQTHMISFASDGNLTPGTGAVCNAAATVVPLTDDSFSQQALGFGFTFYGVTYTDCFIGSNGFITFGAGNTTFSESVALFLSGAPRIAFYWDDFNPAAGGTVSYFTDNSAQAEVCFANVPQFGTTDANTMLCRFDAAQVFMEYGAMASADALVGLSPGGGLGAGAPLNLSLGNNTITAGTAPYELFDGVNNTNDLAGFTVTWILDGSGNPILQL